MMKRLNVSSTITIAIAWMMLATPDLVLAQVPSLKALKARPKTVAIPAPPPAAKAIPVAKAVPAPQLAAGDLTKPMIHIDMAIIESNAGKSAELARVLKEALPDGEPGQSSVLVGGADATGRVLKKLTTPEGIATVLSRPKVMTLAGVPARIQVGQVVSVPDDTEKGKMRDQEIGLSLNCLPELVGDEIQLSLRIDQSSISKDRKRVIDGVDFPSIDVIDIETMLSIHPDQTIGLQAHTRVDQSLVVLIKPTLVARVPQPPKPVAIDPETDFDIQLTAYEYYDSFMGRLQQLEKAVKDSFDGEVQDISLTEDVFEIAIVVRDAKQVPSVLEAVAKVPGIKVENARVTSRGSQTNLLLMGKFAGGRSDEVRSNAAEEPVSDAFRRLKAAIDELFPNDEIVVRELNSSVILRGNLDERTALVVICVAEDYYPRVINDISIVSAKKATESPKESSDRPKKGNDASLNQLREEVAALHADVKRLINLIESKPQPVAQPGIPSSPANDSTAADVRPSANATGRKKLDWEMTLEWAQEAARSNASDEQTEDAEHRDSAIQNLFNRLKVNRAETKAAQELLPSHDTALQIVSATHPLSDRRNLARIQYLKLEGARLQAELRERIGIPADGRRIVPIESETDKPAAL